MITSPLRYPGGKNRIVEKIVKHIPFFEEYREPFLGGGSVFVYVKQMHPNKRYWVNDLYNDLYIFWKVSQSNLSAMINKVYELRAEYKEGKELFYHLKNNFNSFDEVEQAASFFIFNRITFSGTTLSGGYSEGAFKGRFTESSIQRLLEFEKVLKDTLITHNDYEILLKQDGYDVFIFLDPPYFSATKSALYGKNGNLHKSFDHIRFAENLRQCKHKWLLTYDDCDYIRELFSFAYIIQWDLIYGMRNVTEFSEQQCKELLISNYPLQNDSVKYTQLSLFNEVQDIEEPTFISQFH
jgi:DNA adenine methylase